MVWWMTAVAWATGALFGSDGEVVEPTAHQVVLSVEGGWVETHIRLSYQGQAREFAWLVPVAGEPQLFSGAQGLFDAVREATTPEFSVEHILLGQCRHPRRGSQGREVEPDCPDSVCESTPGIEYDPNAIPVIEDTGQVSPWDTSLLQVTEATELVQWLRDRDYDVAPGTAERLEPWVASSSTWVALQFTRGQRYRQIAPLAFRYRSTEPSIPIRTSADIPLNIWLLGPHRAVPADTRHVRINPFALPWPGVEQAYTPVVHQAIEEAAGAAFATVAALDTARVGRVLANPVSVLRLRDADPAPERFFVDYLAAGFPFNPGTRAVLERHVDLPEAAAEEGFTALGWWACLADDCRLEWPELVDDMSPIDVESLAADLEASWLRPLQHLESTVHRQSTLTRLHSVSTAALVDPRFTFNPDMAGVEPQQTATVELDCGSYKHSAAEAPRQFVAPDGRRVALAPAEEATIRASLRDHLPDIAAEVIEETGPTGEPTVITSRTAELQIALDQTNEIYATGCAHGGRHQGPALLPLLLLTARRRS